VLGLVSPAAADDFDILRGSQPVGPATFTRWSGFYAGGQVGLSSASAGFSNATQSLVAYSLRETTLEQDDAPSQWQVLGTASSNAVGYGGFAGYNTQWQDLIVGVEANYNHAAFSLHAPVSPIGRTTFDSTGSAYTVNITGSGSMAAEDFATLRLRSGWVVGDFLPYGFIGLALGVASTSTSATTSGEQYTSGVVGTCTAAEPCFPFSFINNAGVNQAMLYGLTIGAGVDVAITANIFLRAEFEWDQFNPPPGFFASIASGRVGAGFKF
jgi:opacity protein-like surface antigen